MSDGDPVTDRAIGALLGLAVGDAVGTTLEFALRDSKAPVTDMVGGGPFRLEPGQWTDDTAMALALANSLAGRDIFNPRDCINRFVNWYGDPKVKQITGYLNAGYDLSDDVHLYAFGGYQFRNAWLSRGQGGVR